MITWSGELVLPDNQAAPSLDDIAVALGRMPRFAGSTSGWWSVLMHSVLCGEIAKEHKAEPRLVLLCLIHDAHETITADIPTTWKTDEMRKWQVDLDRRIYKRLKVKRPTHTEALFIHSVDQEALRAEAYEVGPPGIREWFHIYEAPPYVPIVQGILRKHGWTIVNSPDVGLAREFTQAVRRYSGLDT